jgi:AAA domain, putative AbiEii toxin, Type IV TA system
VIIPLSAITFDPPLDRFVSDRAASLITVLAGPNNSGKSLVLKWTKRTIGSSAYMVGSNRFYHIYLLSTMLRDPREIDNWETNFLNQFGDPQFNYEQNFIDLGRIITGLSDAQRKRLFDLCEDILETPFRLRKAEEDNDLSMRYVEVGDQNISVASTGARLLITLLGICMDDRFSALLIDEPELGLSPRVQERLAALFQDPGRRELAFPHLRQIFIATHSHLFLAPRNIEDNFVVTKAGNQISLTQVTTTSEYHRLQFNLLGNSLESLFLPAGIVVVEGKCDVAYIDRIIQLRFPGRRLTVIGSGGNVKQKVHGLREVLGELGKSPFRSRLFVVLDAVHQPGLSHDLTNLGVHQDNIVTWSRNGIEYLYPEEILKETLGGTSTFTFEGDRVVAGDVQMTKAQLCDEVVRRVDSATVLPEELETKLLSRIANAIG